MTATKDSWSFRTSSTHKALKALESLRSLKALKAMNSAKKRLKKMDVTQQDVAGWWYWYDHLKMFITFEHLDHRNRLAKWEIERDGGGVFWHVESMAWKVLLLPNAQTYIRDFETYEEALAVSKKEESSK